MRSASSQRLRGFTLLEVMIVIIVLMILISLLLPAVQSSRESARRIQCRNNLGQLGVALQHYAVSHSFLPPGSISTVTPVTQMSTPDGIGWLGLIMPQLGFPNVYRSINSESPLRSFATGEPKEAGITEELWEQTIGPYGETKPNIPLHPTVSILRCPSLGRFGNSGTEAAISSYAGCHHSSEKPIDADADGLLYVNSSESIHAIPDGSSNTALLGEWSEGLPGFGWVFGDRGTLRNATLQGPASGILSGGATLMDQIDERKLWEDLSEEEQQALLSRQKRVGGFSSSHAMLVHMLLADGSVRDIRRSIQPKLFRQLVRRNDIHEVDF